MPRHFRCNDAKPPVIGHLTVQVIGQVVGWSRKQPCRGAGPAIRKAAAPQRSEGRPQPPCWLVGLSTAGMPARSGDGRAQETMAQARKGARTGQEVLRNARRHPGDGAFRG
jgi:hypothetical protein